MFADDTTIPLPAMYIDTADPAVTYTDGRVKAGRLWLDTSTGTIGTLKKRNAANTGWDTLINLDAPAVPNDSVTNAILANMAQGTIKGRAAGVGTGDPTDLSASQVRSILLDMQRWTVNFTANGDAYIPADVAMTIDAGVTAIGTGTLAYEKSTAAAPSTFASTTLPATLEAGAWLKVSVTSLSGFKAVELKRTA